MKLIKDEKSVWETHFIEGFPFGIEKIDSSDYVVFRLFGSRRIYLREDGFTSKAQALAYLANDVNTYKNSIVEAI